MATYPVYPATTFTQAVELTIFASNQLHDVINGDALTTVETENGDVPTLRKALVDNFYFKTPINWVEGESATVFNQLYYFDGTLATSGWYYAPQATLDNPITMGSTPSGDDNWRLYKTATQSIPAQVYPWSTEITQVTSSIVPPYEFDTAIVTYNSAVLVPGKDYTIANNTITFTPALVPEPDAEVPDVLFCYIGKVQEGNSNLNYVTYNSLAAPTAAGIIGTSSSKTVQEELDKTVKQQITFTTGGTLYSQLDRISDGIYLYYWTGTFPKEVAAGSTIESTGGIGHGFWTPDTDFMFSTDNDASIDDLMQKRGMYDVTPEMDDVQAIAGITFGGRKNAASILVDNRGRMSVKASVDGLETSSDVMVPFSEGTGYFRGPYQDVLVRFPVTGQADDDMTYGLLCSYDQNTGRPVFGAVSPRQYDKEGLVNWGPENYAYGTPVHYQVREIAFKNDIGRALSNSFDSYFLYNNPGVRYVKIATITNPSNAANASFAAAIVIGNWGAYTQRTYMLNVNAQNASQQNVTKDNIQQWIQFTCVHGSRDNHVVNTSNYPSIGIVQTKSSGVFEVYLRVPTNSKLLSCTVLNCGDSSLIKFDWTQLITRYTDLPSAEPAGVIYANTAFPYTTNDTVMLNDGRLVLWESGHILRVGNSTVATKRLDFLQTPFISGGALHAHSNSSSALSTVNVTQNADNTYTVSGCSINWTSFRLKEPVGFPGQSSGNRKLDYYVKFENYNNAEKTFTFSIRTISYAGTYDAASGSVTITETLSAPITIPDYTWVDFNITI